MVVLILRSAHAEDVPQTCRRVRASRRMRTDTAWPSCFETHRSALRLRKRLRSRRAAMLLSMRGRGRRAFWRNEPNGHFGETKPTIHFGSSSRKRGPMITAGGYGAGTTSLGAGGTPTCGCTKSRRGQFSLFRIDINNENCNSNVLGRRGPCVTPYVTPMCHHASSSDVPPSVVIRVTIRRHPTCHHPSS
jgi:hypothetical protein